VPTRRVREPVPPKTGKGSRGTPVVLIDTNVVLDLMLDRAPWSNDAARLFTAAHQGVLDAWVSAHALSTVHYIVERERGRQVAAAAIADLLSIVRVVPLDGAAFQRALTLGLADYEDARASRCSHLLKRWPCIAFADYDTRAQDRHARQTTS